MVVFKCKMCGGDLSINKQMTVGICQYCNSTMSLPKNLSSHLVNLYNRANLFRLNSEFDKAAGLYESILNEDNTEAEAYWGLVLCKYGIEYVEDPATHLRVPTCHRTQFGSIFSDLNYKLAIQNAEIQSREFYEVEAEAIEGIQKQILEISSKENPFDVFICYKDLNDNGSRTPDSVLAQDLFYRLTQEGFQVFFSRITLENKLGTAYEPYIFAALSSSPIMVVIGTKAEHLNSPWVKNEWGRYLALIYKGEKKTLIPAFRDMDPYDIPEELLHLQALDMSKLGFTQDLIHGIKKLITEYKGDYDRYNKRPVNTFPLNAKPLLERAFLSLEDGDFIKADELLEQVLNLEPKNASAYVGKLLVELKLPVEELLVEQKKPLTHLGNYQKAVRFANAKYQKILEGYNQEIEKRIEYDRLEKSYHFACEEMKQCQSENSYSLSAKRFFALGDYKDSKELSLECTLNAKELIYKRGKEAKLKSNNDKDFLVASLIFKKILGYKDSDELSQECVYLAQEMVTKQEKQRKRNKKLFRLIFSFIIGLGSIILLAFLFIRPIFLYNRATTLLEKNKYAEAAIVFGKTGNYKDAYEQAFSLYSKFQNKMAAGLYHSVGLNDDGTVVAAGNNGYGKLAVSEWQDIEAVATGSNHTVGLKTDGTVVAVGSNSNGQLEVSGWYDIVAIAAGGDQTVGLKSDGTIVAVGKYGTDSISGWRDIVSVKAGMFHIVGLRSDGTVVATGSNGFGQLDVSGWKNIIAIAAGPKQTFGLKANGRVVGIGYDVSEKINIPIHRNIVLLDSGVDHLVVLKATGATWSAGNNEYKQTSVSDWSRIVCIVAGKYFTLGLTADGKVLATGTNANGQLTVSSWDLLD